MPIVIPIAIGVYELALIAGALITAAWFSSPQGREATHSAGRALGKALARPRVDPIPIAPEVPRTCPKEQCDDKCGPLLAEIQELMAELRSRINDLEIDKKNLYEIRPQRIEGIGSWPGHIQQFQNKQVQLRNLLEDAAALGCPIPPGAWHLATRNPPNRPHRKNEVPR